MTHIKLTCPICGVQVGKPGLKPHVESHGPGLWSRDMLDAKPQPTTRPYREPDVLARLDRLQVSPELAEVALMGLRKTRAEIDSHIRDLEAVLNPPTRRGRPKTRPVGTVQTHAGADDVTDEIGFHYEPQANTPSGYYRKIWDNDPDGLYQHDKWTGEIRTKLDGSPVLKALHKGQFKSAPIKLAKRRGRPPKAKVNGHAAEAH